ncbi:MAG TPA: alpha/beta hydrolase [Bacteriovoracaceae bacterium]|nr:alpha/beta hydrolase [Bacteriovoracaceae bacterium]
MKKTLILLHAELGIKEDLDPLKDLLKDKLDVHTFTFSGHGNMPAADEFRVEQFARELDEYISSHKLDAPYVFGHGLGGYVALFHKANFEHSNIEKIFTYGTKFNWSDNSIAKELPLLNPDLVLEKFPQVMSLLKKKHGDKWRWVLQSMAHLLQNLEKLDELTSEDLGEINIPVTLMLGDQDRVISTEETQSAKSHLRWADIQIIAHSKHEIERANLKEISKLILNDLND